MAKLRISASEEEGTLQRAIFEFSRRNIEIERLLYSREGERAVLHITVRSDADALKVVKHLRRIHGVIEVVDSLKQEETAIAQSRVQMTPQEMLG